MKLALIDPKARTVAPRPLRLTVRRTTAGKRMVSSVFGAGYRLWKTVAARRIS